MAAAAMVFQRKANCTGMRIIFTKKNLNVLPTQPFKNRLEQIRWNFDIKMLKFTKKLIIIPVCRYNMSGLTPKSNASFPQGRLLHFLASLITVKIINFGHPKNWKIWFCHRIMRPKDADGMANSADLDQSVPSGAVWSGSTLFSKTCPPKT